MFRCPTCVTVLEDPRAKRCPTCGENLRRHPPLVLGQSARVSAKLQTIDLRPESGESLRRWRRRGRAVPTAPAAAEPQPAPAVVDLTREPAADSIDLSPEPEREPEPESEPAPAHGGPGVGDGPRAPEMGGTSTATRVATPVPRILQDGAGHSGGMPDGGVASPWLLPPRRAWEPPDPAVKELRRSRRRLPRLPRARFPRPRFMRLRALRPRFR